MPLARKDMIGLSLFGGPALPGLAPARRDCPEGEVRRLDGGVMSEIIPQLTAGLLDIEELSRLECAAVPGSGGCAAMFTASSMAFAVEVRVRVMARVRVRVSMAFAIEAMGMA